MDPQAGASAFVQVCEQKKLIRHVLIMRYNLFMSKNSSIEIVRLSRDRWAEYRDLRLLASKDSPRAFISTPVEIMRTSSQVWQDRLANMFFAQTAAGQLAGMIGCYQKDKQKVKHVLHVISFFVVPDFRGQGVGKMLFRQVLDYAASKPEIKKIQLGAVRCQLAAISFYKSHGFEQVGLMKDHIKDGEYTFDKLVFEKYL